MNVTFFSHPRDVEQVYGSVKQLRRSSMLRVIVPVTGESILVSSGKVWKKKRLTAQPVFQSSSVAALFGRALDELPAGFNHTIDTIFELLARRVENPFSLPLWMPLPKHRRFLNAIKVTDGVVYRLLDERLAAGG